MQGGYFDLKIVRGFACVLHFVMARVLWKSPSGYNNRVTSFVIQCMIRIIIFTLVRSDSNKVFHISCPPVLPEARCTGWRTLWPRWDWLPLLSPPRSPLQPYDNYYNIIVIVVIVIIVIVGASSPSCHHHGVFSNLLADFDIALLIWRVEKWHNPLRIPYWKCLSVGELKKPTWIVQCWLGPCFGLKPSSPPDSVNYDIFNIL